MSLPQFLQACVVNKPKEEWRHFGDPDSPRLKVLRFADQAEQQEVFASAGIVAPEGQALPPDFSWPGIGDISVIGRVVDQDAVMGPEDESGFPTIVQEATYLPGWYVNVLVPEIADAPSPSVSAPDGPVQAPWSISPRQARLMLHSLGILEAANAMIAQSPAELQISWEFSTEVRRNDPGVIALATQLGILDQLPDLFLAASRL